MGEVHLKVVKRVSMSDVGRFRDGGVGGGCRYMYMYNVQLGTFELWFAF